MREKELLEYIVKNLVNDKDAVEVSAEEKGGSLILTLKAAEDDMGRIIGRRGKIANSIRTILRASQLDSKKMIRLEIED
ncbi:MAG: KH domain-containing protein [Ezakiella sp.]|nr:KH domain-containing protein [Ezakiella sp.]MDD7762110.1 KH domain-containing protein [Bacillota bacterium]MDY3947039.1 KH domain-containing protein [Ezakiella sp.]